MTEIANADQHAAWNGESGRRWVADAGRRDRVLAPVGDAVLAAAGRDRADAADYLARTGVTRSVLTTIPDDRHTAALDAVRTILAEHVDDVGVHLAGAIWIVTARRT